MVRITYDYKLPPGLRSNYPQTPTLLGPPLKETQMNLRSMMIGAKYRHKNFRDVYFRLDEVSSMSFDSITAEVTWFLLHNNSLLQYDTIKITEATAHKLEVID